jgi:hypothetical protein
MPNEQITKMKVVYLQKLYKFLVEHIFISINFFNKKYV